MLKPGLAAAALTALALHAAPARAAVVEDNFNLRNTADLVALCSAGPEDSMFSAAKHFCHGFGVGAYQVLEQEQAAARRRTICMPKTGVTRNDAVAKFVTWAQAKPANMEMIPADAVFAFLSQTDPCTR